ncbi:hypothetical protein SAY87_022067 [Trapa incisa]|uniref:Uncharacterized protein n=1 Tax=Trapa incisa TaxID=236973 RepID=A0AAN7JUD6_9MYRT|nr:hypothetical protein SAY87_022067 [Trapa incisa]
MKSKLYVLAEKDLTRQNFHPNGGLRLLHSIVRLRPPPAANKNATLTSKEKSRAALSLLKAEKSPDRIVEICRAPFLTPDLELNRIAYSVAISSLTKSRSPRAVSTSGTSSSSPTRSSCTNNPGWSRRRSTHSSRSRFSESAGR